MLTSSGSQSPISWIVGASFLKNVYSVFRYNPLAIGFAQLSGSAQSVSNGTTVGGTATNGGGTTGSGGNGTGSDGGSGQASGATSASAVYVSAVLLASLGALLSNLL
jgi:hypothetical protein